MAIIKLDIKMKNINFQEVKTSSLIIMMLDNVIGINLKKIILLKVKKCPLLDTNYNEMNL